MPTHSARTLLRWSMTLALAGLATVAVAGCDSTPGGGVDMARQVTVIGSGEVQGVPDTLTTEAGIEFVAGDVTSAMNQTSERQQAVIEALVDAGVDRKDISTTQVSLQPQYGSSELGGSTNITGYRAGNTIRVKVERDSASQVLAVIVRSGGDATRINGVSYSIEDDSQLVRDARERAFNDAKDRAEQYAHLSGLQLGRVISISEVAGASPPPVPVGMPMPRAMAAAPPMEPGQQTVGFSVTAIWELV
ncbi:SIMPL domain-containing protein [[Mycobacterium] nativiensis]|uniref:SIMPL domain-containing protein n=1 Tax=[Mycobacterium] nativiensis TaxID=2855503 RepID=A0ABU5Y3L1_9MYCO|nr:SIMPL domain-containing protein [Mycolicibacter sp. MYC340]MEB3034738.1 SIMPL domain-containing protein [Mycolicibacter sp. MYC340]